MPDMPDDRVLLARILATLTPVLDRAREMVTAAQRVPQLEAEIAELREQQGRTVGSVDLAPLGAALDELTAVLWPAAEQSPDVTPVTDLHDVPAVLRGDLDPGEVSRRSDADALADPDYQ